MLILNLSACGHKGDLKRPSEIAAQEKKMEEKKAKAEAKEKKAEAKDE